MDDYQNQSWSPTAASNLPYAAPGVREERRAAADCDEPAGGVVRQMRALAGDIASFIARQNARLERLAHAAPAMSAGEADLDRRRAQLAAREQEWDQRQREALQRVEDECAQLAAAWDRLEAEQRRLLAQGAGGAQAAASFQSGPSQHGSSQPDQFVQRAADAAGENGMHPAGDVDLIGDLDLPAMTGAGGQPWSREPAAQQFQQMNREIRRHARRRRT